MIAQMSKEDEIDALRKFAAKFRHGETYLADLFTAEFLDWAEKQILDDFPPDFMDALQTANRRAADALQEKNKAIEELRAQVKQFQGDLTVAEAMLKRFNERIQELTEVVHRKDEIMERNVDEADRLRDLFETVKRFTAAHWLEGKDIQPEELRSILVNV